MTHIFHSDPVDGAQNSSYEETLEALLSLIGRPVLVLVRAAGRTVHRRLER